MKAEEAKKLTTEANLAQYFNIINSIKFEAARGKSFVFLYETLQPITKEKLKEDGYTVKWIDRDNSWEIDWY